MQKDYDEQKILRKLPELIEKLVESYNLLRTSYEEVNPRMSKGHFYKTGGRLEAWLNQQGNQQLSEIINQFSTELGARFNNDKTLYMIFIKSIEGGDVGEFLFGQPEIANYLIDNINDILPIAQKFNEQTKDVMLRRRWEPERLLNINMNNFENVIGKKIKTLEKTKASLEAKIGNDFDIPELNSIENLFAVRDMNRTVNSAEEFSDQNVAALNRIADELVAYAPLFQNQGDDINITQLANSLNILEQVKQPEDRAIQKENTEKYLNRLIKLYKNAPNDPKASKEYFLKKLGVSKIQNPKTYMAKDANGKLILKTKPVTRPEVMKVFKMTGLNGKKLSKMLDHLNKKQVKGLPKSVSTIKDVENVTGKMAKVVQAQTQKTQNKRPAFTKTRVEKVKKEPEKTRANVRDFRTS